MFTQPQYLAWLIAIPIAIVIGVWLEWQRQRARRRLADARLIGQLTNQHRGLQRFLPDLAWLITLGIVILALSRPVWEYEEESIAVQSAAIMVVLDVSRSMLAQDVDPSRLERAKITLTDLVANLQSNHQIGIVVFAGIPITYLPLTSDMQTAQSFIDRIHTGIIPRQGTAIQEALAVALDALNTDDETGKLIILLSDGENHETDPLPLAEQARIAQIPIHVLSYGTPIGAPIPDATSATGYSTVDGVEIISRPNLDLLQQIAQTSGGIYQAVNAFGEEIPLLIEQIALAQNQPIGGVVAEKPIERYHWVALIAFALLCLQLLLPEARRV